VKVGIDAMLLSGAFSGVEQYIFNLCAELAAGGYDLDLTAFVPLDFPGPRPAEGLRLKRAVVPGRIRTLRIAWEQFWFPFKVFSYGFELFHFPGYIHPYVKGIPTVLTVHDIIAFLAPELCKRTNRYYYHGFLKKSVERATRIIVPSERVKRDLWKHMRTPLGKIDVVPMGTDMGRYRGMDPPPVREKFGIGEEPYLLFVGNIEPKKGLPLLVQAVFAAVMHRKLPHRLVIAGRKGWKTGKLFRLLRELGEEFNRRVVFTGYVSREELYGLYREAELFVFPSLVEGFGIPPLEAMACGTPVLLSREPALVETYRGCAHFFKNGDLKDLREKIEFLVEDGKERRAYVEKGKRLAEKLTWKSCAARTVEVYRKAREEYGA